jgi:hypothetical protein
MEITYLSCQLSWVFVCPGLWMVTTPVKAAQLSLSVDIKASWPLIFTVDEEPGAHGAGKEGAQGPPFLQAPNDVTLRRAIRSATVAAGILSIFTALWLVTFSSDGVLPHVQTRVAP